MPKLKLQLFPKILRPGQYPGCREVLGPVAVLGSQAAGDISLSLQQAGIFGEEVRMQNIA